MYIEAVPNRNSPPAILLRESYRPDGKVRKRTICNLSDWPAAHIEGLRGVLKGGVVIPAERDAFTSPAVCRTGMLPLLSELPAKSALMGLSVQIGIGAEISPV